LFNYHNLGFELHPGELLFAYPPFVTDEASGGVRLKAIPATEVIRVHADFAAQIQDLTDGAKIRIHTDKVRSGED